VAHLATERIFRRSCQHCQRQVTSDGQSDRLLDPGAASAWKTHCVGKSAYDEFVAADIYPKWKRRVAAAAESVRVYCPYLDRLAVDLLGNSALGPENVAVVTDLSPESGPSDYRGQLLAIRRLISSGIEVRSLPRLHAKVLLVDGRQVTMGSQNFTGYARRSKETSLAADADLGASTFVRILNEWFNEAVPVDGDLVDRLLERLEQPMARAREAIQELINSFGDVERSYRSEVARRRFEEHLAQARLRSPAEALRVAASKSRFSAGQAVAWAHLDWVESGEYKSLLVADKRGLNLTNWRSPARPGRDRAWAVQEERERVPLGGGERGCCLGQFPDPGIQAAAGMVCAMPVGIVTLVALSPVVQGAGARPGCRPGFGLPLRR
jgi:hypothetical protein